MQRNPVVIRIEFPALDRLVDYLSTSQQSEIDALAATVTNLTANLKQSEKSLKDSMNSR